MRNPQIFDGIPVLFFLRTANRYHAHSND